MLSRSFSAAATAAAAKKSTVTFDFCGKVVLLTGGSSGIGRAVALGFGQSGAKVVVGDWNEDGGKATVEAIKKRGGEAVFVKTDVSKDADCKALVDTALSKYGRLDVAFNNAGVAPDMAPLASVADKEWRRVVDIDLQGVFLGMRAQIPAMAKTGGGSIINTASIAGLNGSGGTGAYTAAKHGVIGLTKQAAIDHAAQGVRVNAIAPGVIETPMVEDVFKDKPELASAFKAIGPALHRFGRPEELVSTVLLLASDSTSYTTGATLVIDGGHTAHF